MVSLSFFFFFFRQKGNSEEFFLAYPVTLSLDGLPFKVTLVNSSKTRLILRYPGEIFELEGYFTACFLDDFRTQLIVLKTLCSTKGRGKASGSV